MGDKLGIEMADMLFTEANPSPDTIIANIITIIKKYNLAEYFNPNSPLNVVMNVGDSLNIPLDTPINNILGFMIMLGVLVDINWCIMHPMHYKFCRAFIAEFKFFPIMLSLQKNLDMSMYNDAFDAFIEENFVTDIYGDYCIHAADYFAVFRRHVECMEGEHGETQTLNRQSVIELLESASLNGIVNIPVSTLEGKVDLQDIKRIFGDIETIHYKTLYSYYDRLPMQ
jgi:hypothetical protein